MLDRLIIYINKKYKTAKKVFLIFFSLPLLAILTVPSMPFLGKLSYIGISLLLFFLAYGFWYGILRLNLYIGFVSEIVSERASKRFYNIGCDFFMIMPASGIILSIVQFIQDLDVTSLVLAYFMIGIALSSYKFKVKYVIDKEIVISTTEDI